METCSFEALHMGDISYVSVAVSEIRPGYVTQIDLELTVITPHTSASPLLRLQTCGTVPGCKLVLGVAQ